jgi:oligosaccharide repeat unit polymerase
VCSDMKDLRVVAMVLVLGTLCGLLVAGSDATGWAVLAFGIVVITGLALGSRLGFQPFIVLVVYSAYSLPATIGMYLRQEGSQILAASTFLFATGFVGLFAGLALGSRSYRVTGHVGSSWQSTGRLIPGAATLYVLTGGYYLWTLSRGYGGLMNLLTMGRGIAASGVYNEITVNTSAYGVLVMFGASVVVLFAELYDRHKWVAWLSLMVPIGFLLAIGNRSTPAFVGLALLGVFLHRGWRPRKWAVVAVALSAYLVVGPLGQARLYWHGGWSNVVANFNWAWFDISSSELAAPVATTRTLLENGFRDWRFGATYLQGAVNALPSFLQPVEFERPSIWYMRIYMPEYLEGGFGAGFSPVTEGFMNLSWIGPLVIMFVVGFLLTTTIRFPLKERVVGPYVAITLMASFVNFTRIDFSSAVAQYLFVGVGLCFIYIVSTLVSNKSEGGNSTRPASLHLLGNYK